MRFFQRPKTQPTTGFIASIQHLLSGPADALFGAGTFRLGRPDATGQRRGSEVSEVLYAAAPQDDPPEPQQPQEQEPSRE